MKKNGIAGKQIAYLGIMAAFAILCGYIENLIPFAFGIPGMKLGLANIVTVVTLYLFGIREAAAVSFVRILAVGILFGNPYSLAYSLAGGILSLVCMQLLKGLKQFSVTGVSIGGGIAHNIGQLAVAVFVVQEIRLAYYVPFLLIAGALTGMLIGLLAKVCNIRLERLLHITETYKGESI